MSATPLPSIARPTLPPAPTTFADFLAWSSAGIHAEWVDGEVIVMSPASREHQALVKFLVRLIDAFVEAHGLGEVIIAPFAMSLPSRPSGREPDLLFVAMANLHRLHDTHLDGPANLAVEVVSPESDSRDRGDKFVEYEAAGIDEYWLIDPLRRAAIFYQLGADGRYQAGPITADGIYRSAVLEGFWLRVDWLWQRPAVAVALRELSL